MPTTSTEEPSAWLAWDSARARWVLAATVLGAGLTFIDATVVTIALPRIGEDLGTGTQGLTWVVNAYSLTLASLVLLGGVLGDRWGQRRVFLVGVVWFAVTSAACGLAPDSSVLVVSRAAQGIGAALMTPASLALLQGSFAPSDRARAIGAWSGLTGVAGAVGPFVGGWLVEFADWRWAFLLNLPLALAVVVVVVRRVPEDAGAAGATRLDWAGAGLLASALSTASYGLTAWSERPFPDPLVAGPLAAGLLLGAAFVRHELRAADPLVSLDVFGSAVFVAVNAVTLLVYGALGAVFFSIGIVLQVGAGRGPIEAGLALFPVTVIMLAFSSRAGDLTTRLGARAPLALGCGLAAAGTALLTRVGTRVTYAVDVLPAAVVLGTGITLLVTPLTATALSSVPDSRAGLASGVNNAVARAAGLLAVAVVPLVGGWGGSLTDPSRIVSGFHTVLWCSAALLLAAGAAAAVTTPGRVVPGHRPAARHCSPAAPPVGHVRTAAHPVDR